MMLRRLILPAAASMLLLTGCGSEAVKGLSAGGRADTANFSIWIPNSLYKTEEPESALWDLVGRPVFWRHLPRWNLSGPAVFESSLYVLVFVLNREGPV